MATGTTAGFWDEEKSPALLKHEILGRYVPPFVAKLGSTYGKVVLLDGYAGAGKYLSGAQGSALQMVQIASDLVSNPKMKIEVDVFLIERDPKTISFLKKEIARFSEVERLKVFVMEGDVGKKFEEVTLGAAKCPLFVFLDPCGLGLPFETLGRVLSRLRPASGVNSAPTEILLNFSADAVRRIGGLVNLPSPEIATLNRMDATVGGVWWREFYRGEFDKEKAETEVVNSYVSRLAKVAKMFVFPIPVRRDVGHRPVYYLVFGTRHRQGAWYYADAAARSAAKWRVTVESRKSTGQLTFDGIGATAQEQVVRQEDEAESAISKNLLGILKRHGDFMVGDYPIEVFGDFLGLVREQVVRAAIKSLYKEGTISSNGVGKDIFKLRVTRPVQ